MKSVLSVLHFTEKRYYTLIMHHGGSIFYLVIVTLANFRLPTCMMTVLPCVISMVLSEIF